MARQVLHASDSGGHICPNDGPNQASMPQVFPMTARAVEYGEAHRGPSAGGHGPSFRDDMSVRRRRDDNEFPMPSFRNAGGLSASVVPADIVAGLASRKREADKIDIPDLPSALRFRTWRAEVRRAVVAASAKPQEAFAWVTRAEKLPPPHGGLDPPKEFQSLDVKLSAGLHKILRGELQRRAFIVSEHAARHGRMLGGLRLLSIIHEWFSTESYDHQVRDLGDLVSIQCLAGGNLPTFWVAWTEMCMEIAVEVPEQFLEQFLYSKIRHLPSLALDMQCYQRWRNTQPSRPLVGLPRVDGATHTEA
eukprot:6478223-Amphidinium_carterae.3